MVAIGTLRHCTATPPFGRFRRIVLQNSFCTQGLRQRDCVYTNRRLHCVSCFRRKFVPLQLSTFATQSEQSDLIGSGEAQERGIVGETMQRGRLGRGWS